MLSTFTVKKADGATDAVYNLQSAAASEASYIDATASLASPRLIKVSHSLKPIGSAGSDRHTVLAQSVVSDSLGNPHVMSASLTWTVPRNAAATDTLAKDCLVATLNYLSLTGVKDALIDGILP